MTKDEFQQLLQRYKEGNCSPEEIQKINDWFDKISTDHFELNEWEKVEFEKRILTKLRQTLPSGQKTKSRGFPVFRVAASLVIVMLAVFFLADRNAFTPPVQLTQDLSSSRFEEYKNSSEGILEVLLPDGSVVELAPGAEIFYDKQPKDQKREVHLIGEAFFEVVKDRKRPFYVYGGKIVTKVLGTSFSVKAPKNAQSIEVEVRTGKVSVYEETDQTNPVQNSPGASGVILTPNEKVEYFVEDKHWVTSLVEKPKPLPSTNKTDEFIFNGTPMKEIINNIEKNYDIDIIIENENSYSCTFTGDVSMMELYDMLKVICKSIGAAYEVKGTKILITGNGCE